MAQRAAQRGDGRSCRSSDPTVASTSSPEPPDMHGEGSSSGNKEAPANSEEEVETSLLCGEDAGQDGDEE